MQILNSFYCKLTNYTDRVQSPSYITSPFTSLYSPNEPTPGATKPYINPPPNGQHRTPWQYQLISGALAGATSAFVVSPLDVARIRIQIAPAQMIPGPFGFRVIRKMVQKEGLLSLYRGLGPNMVALVPNWMSYFVAYSQFRENLRPALCPYLGVIGFDIVNAIVAGGFSTLCTHPLWLIKTRFQVQGLKARYGLLPTAGEAHDEVYRGTIDALRRIFASQGIKGLYNGFIPQLFGLFHVGIHFPLYEFLKRKMYAYNVKSRGLPAGRGLTGSPSEYSNSSSDHAIFDMNNPQSPYKLSTMQIVTASTISKTLASTAAYPHEVLRARFQTQDFLRNTNLPLRPRYSSILQALGAIVKEDGFRGLYRGLDVTLIRSVPACIVTFVVYEKTTQYLNAHSFLKKYHE